MWINDWEYNDLGQCPCFSVYRASVLSQILRLPKTSDVIFERPLEWTFEIRNIRRLFWYPNGWRVLITAYISIVYLESQKNISLILKFKMNTKMKQLPEYLHNCNMALKGLFQIVAHHSPYTSTSWEPPHKHTLTTPQFPLNVQLWQNWVTHSCPQLTPFFSRNRDSEKIKAQFWCGTLVSARTESPRLKYTSRLTAGVRFMEGVNRLRFNIKKRLTVSSGTGRTD